MHDRRLNGETLTFGNHGRLYKNAMTWWDHGTGSIWAQPWGTAILGPLKDTALTLIPASVVPWSTWLAEHPDSTVVTDDYDKIKALTTTPDPTEGMGGKSIPRAPTSGVTTATRVSTTLS